MSLKGTTSLLSVSIPLFWGMMVIEAEPDGTAAAPTMLLPELVKNQVTRVPVAAGRNTSG